MRIITIAVLVLAVSSHAGAQDTTSRTALGKAADVFERAASARASKKVSERYDPAFRKYTKRYFGPAFDWRYFKAQGFAESGLKANATSWVGARGVMQLMPSTYQEIASRRPEFGPIDQPEWNIAAGIMHDRYLWNLWLNTVPDDERHRFMFASYNAGEGTINRAFAVAKSKGSLPAWSSIEVIAPSVQRWRYLETLGYVRRIDSTYSRLTAIR
ncbi:MAG TPA: transglycosylase SLT domain-containing protein [Gemmatimonadaceae bacterium]|jgi:membrane-bound lytic murein transglycosylase F|nr:transglycosylase SLT domain-containing protein [Gemmatimonadaceae bacterium]